MFLHPNRKNPFREILAILGDNVELNTASHSWCLMFNLLAQAEDIAPAPITNQRVTEEVIARMRVYKDKCNCYGGIKQFEKFLRSRGRDVMFDPSVVS